MGFFGNTNRISDNISTFFGYDNSSGSEIKVKATRKKEIILTITDSNDRTGTFVFNESDLDTLGRFEIMMTHVFSLYDTFSIRYGIKRNTSDKGVTISIDCPSKISFKISALPNEGILLSVIQYDEVTKSNKNTDFLFMESDKDIINRFKIDFSRLVANISNIKLPPKQVIEEVGNA